MVFFYCILGATIHSLFAHCYRDEDYRPCIYGVGEVTSLAKLTTGGHTSNFKEMRLLPIILCAYIFV